MVVTREKSDYRDNAGHYPIHFGKEPSFFTLWVPSSVL
jgi:hypothetical protein